MRSTDSYIPIVAETGNVSQAAQRLGISQPALSAHIKKVEDEFNITIFDRSKKPFRLTEEGRAYLEYESRKDVLYKEFQNYLADISELNTGNLVVGGATTFNFVYLPKTVREFSREYPGIDLTVVDDRVPDLIARTVSGEVDIFISPTEGDAPELVYEKLFDNRVLLCVPQDDPANEKVKDFALSTEDVMAGNYSGKKPVDITAFRESVFLVLSNRQYMGAIAREMFARYGACPENIINAEQAITAFGLTLEGCGISLFNDTAIKHGSIEKDKLDSLKFYLMDDDISAIPIYVCHSGERSLSGASRKFIEMLKQVNEY